MKPALKLVEPETVDIYAKMRAEVAARDWSAVHVAGDRRAPITLPANWRAPR